MKSKQWLKISAVLVCIAACVALYFLTPVKEFFSVDKIVELTKDIPDSPVTALLFLVLFFVGGALLIPIPLMTFAVSLVFNLWVSVAIAIVGVVLSSLSGYTLGRILGIDAFGSKVEKNLTAIKDKIDDKGPWAVMALRLAPTPPFTITSIIGGSLKLNIWKYCAGTLVGIAPLALSAIFFGKGAIEMMKDPSGLAATSIVAAVILYSVYRVIKHKQTEDNQQESH